MTMSGGSTAVLACATTATSSTTDEDDSTAAMFPTSSPRVNGAQRMSIQGRLLASLVCPLLFGIFLGVFAEMANGVGQLLVFL